MAASAHVPLRPSFREAEVRSLLDSCLVVRDLREAVMENDFSKGFNVIEKYLGHRDGVSDAAQIVKLVHDADYVIHPLARREFGLLTTHVCGGYWKAIESASMEPGMYVRLFSSLLVLSETSSAVQKLCQESTHIISAPVNNIKREDRLPPLRDPFTPGVWSRAAGGDGLRSNQRHNSAQTDGAALMAGSADSSQEEKYHQLVFERESIMQTIEMMREEQVRSVRLLRMREKEALQRIAEEEEKAYAAIDSIVVADQQGFDLMRRQLEQSWCQLESDRSALRVAEETAASTHDARLAELQDTGHRLSRQHLAVVGAKRKVAEKRQQLDLLLRQLNINIGLQTSRKI
jgi:hypothetical protein